MKTYRIYFNRANEFPQVWSIDEGTTTSELNVIAIVLEGVTGRTHYNPQGDNINTPKAWFEVTGNLTIDNGIAYIRDVLFHSS